MHQLLLVTFSVLFFFSGCSISAERLYSESDPKPYVELGGVPFYPGESRTCASATLGMVKGYWQRVGEEQSQGLFSPAGERQLEKHRGDIFPSEMVAEARQRGLIALESKTKSGLVPLINAGFPVIVRLKNGSQRWRYGVVTGYDLGNKEIILHSCESKREVMGMADFLESYKESGYWKLIVAPGSIVPPTITEAQYLKAVHELELSIEDEESVQTAYETALREWPRSLRVLLSVADFFYRKYEYEVAYELYEEILELNPEEPAALTQLAETMYYLGEFERALEYIDVMITKNKKLFKEFDGTRKKIHDSIESGKIVLPNGL